MGSLKPSRREFIRNAALTGIGLGLSAPGWTLSSEAMFAGKRVGIIGLDTSHSIAFTKELNVKKAPEYKGYKVVAAYPYGSRAIESSFSRIAGYTKQVEEMGVKVVDSISALLKVVDVVLLETNDGNLHLEQAAPVIRAGKPLFVDKPVAASLVDTIIIYELAKENNVPIFSSSSLRYMPHVVEVTEGKIGKVLGADTFSPCALEPSHPDLYWYGIHGVEALYAVMGTGCKEISRTHTEGTDVVVGSWSDGRIGTFRGTRTGKHDYGGTAYGENGELTLGPYGGYAPLLKEIIDFFETGVSPVDRKETLEIYTFMAAADESKLLGGARVNLAEMWNRSFRDAGQKMKQLS